MTDYFVMKGFAAEPIVVLYSLSDPSDADGWMLARPFTTTVAQPVEATIIDDNDHGVLMPFYNTPQIMHKDLYATLTGAGVDNVEAYGAVVKRENGDVVSKDYVAYNIIGAVRATDPAKTVYAPENPSRMIDASIRKAGFDPAATKGLLMFRLAESIRTVVVHGSVKAAVEARGFPHVLFLAEGDALF